MRFAELYGLTRSFAMYYGLPWRRRRMEHFYAQFVAPGDLCFDVGSHVGNRIRAFRDLGARVLALEPQPLFVSVLERLYGRDPNVSVRRWAVGDQSGQAELHISRKTPTVTTLSSSWIETVRRDSRFQNIDWDDCRTTEVITLDALIERHGVPAFCKIDVEGLELSVLRGLSRPLPALSFEFIPVAREEAEACVDRLCHLGDYEFNLSFVETMTWGYAHWMSAGEIKQMLRKLPMQSGSGDIYARRKSS